MISGKQKTDRIYLYILTVKADANILSVIEPWELETAVTKELTKNERK